LPGAQPVPDRESDEDESRQLPGKWRPSDTCQPLPNLPLPHALNRSRLRSHATAPSRGRQQATPTAQVTRWEEVAVAARLAGLLFPLSLFSVGGFIVLC